MHLLWLLLLMEGVFAKAHPPHDVLFAILGGSVHIPCLLDDTSLNGTRGLTWYKTTWRDPEKLKVMIPCRRGHSVAKYTCKMEGSFPTLEIQDIHPDHSGVYYCSTIHWESSAFIISKGTSLIIGDGFRSSLSVHLLAPSRLPPAHDDIQLTCVVNISCYSAHITWDVSETPHNGKMISVEEPTGTCMSFLSLSGDTWVYGGDVICDVRLNSTSVQVFWRIPGRGFPTCRLITLRVMLLLLLVSAGYLTWVC